MHRFMVVQYLVVVPEVAVAAELSVLAIGCLSTSIRHVGQVCWRWNHERKQFVWNMWLHGSFLHVVVMSSRHIMHTLSPI